MSYNPLAGDYAPQDPYRQYHGQPEAEQQRMKQMAMGQQDIRSTLAGAIEGAGRTIGQESMKEPNITVNIERMDKILSHLEERITQLEQRLTPFMRPYPKQTRDEHNKTTTSQSALSERLYHQTRRADFLCSRITDTIESIDL